MNRIRKSALDTIGLNAFENSKSLASKLEMRLGAIDSAVSLAEIGQKLKIADAELAAIYKIQLSQNAQIIFESATPKKSRRHIKSYSQAISVADTIVLSRMILERVGRDSGFSGVRLLENESQALLPDDIKIVYRKARGADIAFEKFSSLIPDCAALYRDTFLSVCDAVALGEADMCILPYENTDDGKLNSFYRLIEGFDLKIAASCSVKSLDREDRTRYLLLSKSLSGISNVSGVTDFEFLLSDRSDSTLTRAMSAAHLLGLEIRSIDTVVCESSLNVFDIRVSSKARALDEYILYLKLDDVDFTPLGIFAQID